ncbi:unnamed protein product, partial [Symbiodinium pilosum]
SCQLQTPELRSIRRIPDHQRSGHAALRMAGLGTPGLQSCFDSVLRLHDVRR